MSDLGTTFHVERVYYQPGHDLLVLAGSAEAHVPRGWWVELPASIRGPGWVPIADVQTIAFAGRDMLCIVLAYDVVVPAPFMEFRDLEGLALALRPTDA